MNEKLSSYLLSNQNIQDIVDMLDCTIYISPESLHACKQVIKDNLTSYLTRLANMPQTEKQFIHTVSFLNKKCYDEIVSFIEKNYPGKSIFKQDIEIIMTRQEFEQYLKTRVCHDTVLKTLTDPVVLLYLKTMMDELNAKADETEGEIIDIHQLQAMLGSKQTYQKASIDTSNMTPETISKIQSRIEELSKMTQTDQVIAEKTELIAALVKHQKASIPKPTIITNVNEKQHDIDVMITPKNEEELRSISFRIGTEKKVVRVQLISYFIPKADYNVSSLTNKILVCYNGELVSHTIPPGNYTIDQLTTIIGDLMPFLKISVSDKVTVSANSKFEILVQENSLWPLLGFEPANYSRKMSYQAKAPYVLDINESAFICLDRSNIDPVLVSLDEQITLDNPITLKQTSQPIQLKDITVKIVDKLGQSYDLIGKAFKVHIRVEFE